MQSKYRIYCVDVYIGTWINIYQINNFLPMKTPKFWIYKGMCFLLLFKIPDQLSNTKLVY